MGFLYALMLMCGWMIYGGANFYMTSCNVTMNDGNRKKHFQHSKTVQSYFNNYLTF